MCSKLSESLLPQRDSMCTTHVYNMNFDRIFILFMHGLILALHIRAACSLAFKKSVENVLIDCGCFNMISACFHASLNSVIFFEFEFRCVVSLLPSVDRTDYRVGRNILAGSV